VFDGDSISELCRKHLTEIPVPPGARIGKTFDPQLESLLMRCLAKDPAARPQSARELAQALAPCRLAEQWTLERRAAWWMEHRKTVTKLIEPVFQPDSAQIEKTVRIEFSDRTP
jgi:serine/threonine-protein kinase